MVVLVVEEVVAPPFAELEDDDRAGEGDGDFLERLSGASVALEPEPAAPPAMSTCSSSNRGDGDGAVTTDWGEPSGPVVVLAMTATGGEIDVECGDWK